MKMLNAVFLSWGLLLAAPAYAGFYIEPGITYEKGDNELDWPAPLSSSTGTTRGLGFDLKLGYHANDVFFIGLEGAYSKPKFENSATDYSADATSTLYGAVVGAQMPVVGLRIWGGYIFGGDLDPEEDNGVDVKFEEAKGPKVGVGIKLFMVSVNLEYMDLEYNKSKLEKAGPVSGELDSKLKNKVGLLSMSFPLTF
ncbi:porin family protein [Bdellovibrio bacteriovorus]|uniref:porin family protein n=1 Tax=Bdellovibrio bacteriovorus TaxID=959 RepID=UPI0021D18AD2|nr:porin family protein [Bdellovibrio bacteriovorus]UXR63329.1 porin family protein [Bdellovibrio bacteriovorus]